MNNYRSQFSVFACLVMATFLTVKSARSQESDARARLFAHSAEFKRELVKVTEGVYVAVGFDASNSILIEGKNGVIIVDAMLNETSATAARTAFENITEKPVKAIIYTHHHLDHVGGVRVFAGDGKVDIYTHAKSLRSNLLPRVGPAWRADRQFGEGLSEEERPNNGIGGQPVSGKRGYMEPNRTFSGELFIFEEEGVRIELHYAPGETDGQIFVWLPDKRVLMPGDNFYKAFPNIYPIRGVPLRRADHWVSSLAKMIRLEPEYLVPSHTRPILGADKVKAALTAYHDGIKSILDQTIEGMNQGLTPDELAATVKLPPELADNPYLAEYYGAVPWSVRAIYTFYLGWFDGNASNLFPLPFRERAKRIAKLVGGEAALVQEARAALDGGEDQWAAELTDYVLGPNPNHREARQIKAEALRNMAERQINATARNYYLTTAKALLSEEK